MNPPITAAAHVVSMPSAEADRGFFGHPRGLATLFFTEMWERFSYYGMRAFLILYMTAPAAAGGLGFGDADATSIYGTYTGSAWGASIIGGLVGDRLLGAYRSVLLGGIVIALGHFTLAFRSMAFFYGGLALIVIGTGLLKPNASTLVGALYEPKDSRRDAGFSLFYMGINSGAILGPIIAGYIAQRIDWHIGFAAAGVGMTLGLIQYVIGRKRLRVATERLSSLSPATPVAAELSAPMSARGPLGLTPLEWRRVSVIVIFFLFAILFWGAYEQAGSTITLFADRFTRLEVFGFSFPSSWIQSVQPIFVVILAPTFAWIWLRLGSRDPSVPTKIAVGLLCMGLSFLLLVPAGTLAQGVGATRVSPLWLFLWCFGSELGELCIYPVGMSAVTKLSPARFVGVMMGVWFLSIAFGNKLAGYAAGFISSVPLHTLFGTFAAVLIVAALIMFTLVKPIRALAAEGK